MSIFEEILTANAEDLLKTIYKAGAARDKNERARRSRTIAKTLELTHGQLLCAVGFNAVIRDLPDVTTILGYPNYDALAKTRNEYFMHDVYDRVGIKDILAIYQLVIKVPQHLQVMQYLLATRLRKIEERIEATVSSLVIERYKKEMRAVYNDGVAQFEFVDERLRNTHSGFRALLNEVVMIAESRLIPVGDLFYRENILPEEKRRLIIKGFVPKHLVENRLEDGTLDPKERKVLEEQLRIMA